MQTKTSQRESLFSRILALFVAFVLATSFVNLGAIAPQKAWAGEEVIYLVNTSDCQVIGSYEMLGDEEDNLFYINIEEDCSGVEFADYAEDAEYLDIAGMFAIDFTEGYFPGTNVARLTSSCAATAEDLNADDSVSLYDSLDGFDLSNAYAFYVTDYDEISVAFVINVVGSGQGDPSPEPDPLKPAPSFTATVEGKVVGSTETSPAQGTYTGLGNYSVGAVTVPLYVVTVPEGTTTVSLSFDRGCLAYSYNDPDAFIGPWYDASVAYGGSGITTYEATVDQGWVDYSGNAHEADGTPDFIQVQDVYTATYGAGDLRYAITFVYDDPSGPADPQPGSDPLPAPYDKQDLDSLIANLSARAAASLANDVAYGSGHQVNYAIALGANASDVSGLKASFVADEAEDALSAGRLGKYIMALSAAGVDCRAVQMGDVTRNLVDELRACYAETTMPYDVVCILPALDMYPEDCSDEIAAELDVVLGIDWSNMDGGAWATAASSYQTAAQGVLALARHPEGTDAIQKAVAAIKAGQQPDGGFPYMDGMKSDVDTTATVAAAFAAVGEDIDAVVSDEGASMIDFLVAAADAGLNGYQDATAGSEPLSASTVLMGLTAYVNKANVLDVTYTGEAPQPSPVDPSDDPTDDPASDDQNGLSLTEGSALAQTGDMLSIGIFAAIALGALVVLCGAALIRPSRKNQ